MLLCVALWTLFIPFGSHQILSHVPENLTIHLNSMVQEDAVHSFSYCFHSTEWERKVWKSSTNSGTRKGLLQRNKNLIINNWEMVILCFWISSLRNKRKSTGDQEIHQPNLVILQVFQVFPNFHKMFLYDFICNVFLLENHSYSKPTIT